MKSGNDLSKWRDGFHSCQQLHGVGGITIYRVKTIGGRVVACAHADREPGTPLIFRWATERLKWHLSHFPGFDPTAVVFGNGIYQWDFEGQSPPDRVGDIGLP